MERSKLPSFPYSTLCPWPWTAWSPRRPSSVAGKISNIPERNHTGYNNTELDVKLGGSTQLHGKVATEEWAAPRIRGGLESTWGNGWAYAGGEGCQAYGRKGQGNPARRGQLTSHSTLGLIPEYKLNSPAIKQSV